MVDGWKSNKRYRQRINKSKKEEEISQNGNGIYSNPLIIEYGYWIKNKNDRTVIRKIY